MPVVEELTRSEFEDFYAVYAQAYSSPYHSPWLAAEKRVNLTDDAYGTKIALVARNGAGEIVAGGTAVLPLRDNRTFAFLDLFVAPQWRRCGYGSALLEALIDVGRAQGRSQAFTMALWGVDETDNPARAFVSARGFQLDLLNAVRELQLPATLPEVTLDPAYTLETWRGPCPAEWLEDYAELRRILIQEAPSGAAGIENEHWDAARVRQDEADLIRAGRQMQVTVARTESGVLAGHTQLAFPGDSAEVYQWDTLIRQDHRGHGLGLAVKIHTMHASADLLSSRRRITTENAANNAHMIAINDTLGFHQTAWGGEYVRPM